MFSLSIAFIIYGMINYIRYILGFITFQYAIVSVFFLILGLVVAMLSSMGMNNQADGILGTFPDKLDWTVKIRENIIRIPLSSMVHRYFNEMMSKKMSKGDSLVIADNK